MKVYVLEMVSSGGSIVSGVYRSRKSAELAGQSNVGSTWLAYYINEEIVH